MAIFLPALTPALDANGKPLPSAVWEFYSKGTITPAALSGGATSATANVSGEFSELTLVDATNYRAILKSSAGRVLYDISSDETAFFDAAVKSALNESGQTVSGATWSFFTTGTTTPQSVYADPETTVKLGSVVTANADGRFTEIYLDTAITYKAVYAINGVTQDTLDPVDENAIGTFLNPEFVTALSPGDDWDGTAASGFVSTPTDPTRTTAKPALRLLVPPSQYFTDELLVGVAAAANNAGSLFTNLGLSGVTFNFEGREQTVTSPRVEVFTDTNGNTVTYYGWWVRLKKPTGTAGEAQLYVTATPADSGMQARVIGPYSFFPQTTLYDAEYTINTGEAVAGNNYHDINAAIAAIKSAGDDNPRITFETSASNVAMTFTAPTYTPAGYVTIECADGVTVSWGRTSLTTSATVDSDSNQRGRLDGMWLKGSGHTIDYAYVDNWYNEGVKDHVFDGVNMINSRGAGALWRGGPYFTGTRVRNSPYFLEVTASNLENIAVGASLVRGGTFSTMSRDIFADALCVVGTRVEVHDDTPFNDDTEAFTVVYTGSEATATVARSGAVDPNDATYTFKWGANTQTFTVGKQATDYAGTTSDGYLFSDVVDFINGTLAGLDAGWSATLVDLTGRRASSGCLLGDKGQGFGDTSCKTTALSVRSNFDAHGDWYQQRFGTITENVIAYNNLAYDMQTQNIFISSTSDASDFLFFNNALGNDDIGSDYFDEDTVFSQIGRNNVASEISHVVIAHCSMPNQQLYFRNDGTLSTFDSYCLIANNSTVNIDEAGTGAINATINNNHIHGDQTAIAEALNTTSGGDETTLYADFTTGDFTPAGALLTNLKVPIVALDRSGVTRAATDAAGSEAI